MARGREGMNMTTMRDKPMLLWTLLHYSRRSSPSLKTSPWKWKCPSKKLGFLTAKTAELYVCQSISIIFSTMLTSYHWYRKHWKCRLGNLTYKVNYPLKLALPWWQCPQAWQSRAVIDSHYAQQWPLYNAAHMWRYSYSHYTGKEYLLI